MSKESYVRGFCKAAEDAGVDPVALAKYAQWAPRNVAKLSMDEIPSYSGYMGDSSLVRREITPISLLVDSDETKDDTHSHLRSLVDPEFRKWWTAHTNAMEQAAKPVREAIRSGLDTSLTNNNWLANLDIESNRINTLGSVKDHEVMKNLAKIYHDSMKNSTGSVSRVSQSAKK